MGEKGQGRKVMPKLEWEVTQTNTIVLVYSYILTILVRSWMQYILVKKKVLRHKLPHSDSLHGPLSYKLQGHNLARNV